MSTKKPPKLLIAGVAYFPEARGLKYHRLCVLSLLCSEWEEVEHTQIKHRQTRILVVFCSSRGNQLFEIEILPPISNSAKEKIKETIDILVPLG